MKKFSFDMWNDWEAIFAPWDCSWIDFTLVHVSAEWDKRFGNAQVHVGILGVHAQLTINLSGGDKDLQDQLSKMMTDLGLNDDEH